MYKFIDLDTGLPAALNKIKTWVNTKLATKQDALVSGTNIKTVGGVSLLGSGDVPVSTQSSSSVSVLFVGNSLTQDAVSYLPLVLKEIVPNLTFKFYMWYDGGYTLTQILDKWNNNGNAQIFSVCEDVTSWTNYNNSKTIANVLSDYDFDIVSLEEYFNYKRENGYTNADKQVFNDIIDYLRTNYDKAFKVVSFFHRPLVKNPSTNVADLAIADEVFGLTYDGVRWQLENTISESVIPTGIAAYRAMRDTTLNGLGSFGYMSYEGTHSQEGLPCLMQAWCCAMWLLDKLGMPVSINNSQTRVTSSNYSSINVPGPNGSVVVGTTAQDRDAMDVAIKAFKEGKRLETGCISPNGIPAYKVIIEGASETVNERSVRLSASFLPTDADASAVTWAVVSGDATITQNGILNYNGSSQTAAIVVSATLQGGNLKGEATVSFALNAVETPVFSPSAGTYVSGQSITISCATAGATIHYTTDGSTPTSASQVYSSALTLSSSMTLKAIAIKDGESSNVATASYTVNMPVQVTISVSDGENAVEGATVTMSANGVDYTPTSSSSGNYVFSLLSGEYLLTIEKTGFYTHTETVNVSGSMTKSVTLEHPIDMLAHAELRNAANVYIQSGKGYYVTSNAQRATVIIANQYVTTPITWDSTYSISGYSVLEIPSNAVVVDAIFTNSNYKIWINVADSSGNRIIDTTYIAGMPFRLRMSDFPTAKYISFAISAIGTWANTSFADLGLTCYAHLSAPADIEYDYTPYMHMINGYSASGVSASSNAARGILMTKKNEMYTGGQFTSGGTPAATLNASYYRPLVLYGAKAIKVKMTNTDYYIAYYTFNSSGQSNNSSSFAWTQGSSSQINQNITLGNTTYFMQLNIKKGSAGTDAVDTTKEDLGFELKVIL